MRKFSVIVLLLVLALPALAQGNGNAVEILRANYATDNGSVDVTDRVLSLVRGDELRFRVSAFSVGANSRARNGVLQLTVRRRNGQERRMSYRDGETVDLRVIQHWGRDRDDRWGRGRRASACFYRDGFDSAQFCVDAGESAVALPAGFNDAVTSIQLLGGAQVVVFDGQNYSGASQVFSESVRDLRYVLGGRWNDRISSVRVEGSGYGGGPYDRDRDDRRDRDRRRGGACFYRDGFDSARFCVDEGESMASLPPGFNEQITAVEVFGGAEVIAFRDPGFRGSQQSFADDVRDLRYVLGGRWNDQISSVRVERRSGGRDDWWGRDRDDRWRRNTPRDGACFYLDGFESQSFCLNTGESAANLPAGFHSQITAIELFGRAHVMAYRDAGFGGDRQMFGQSVPDLRYVLGGRWNDRIGSVRVEWPR